MLWGTREGNRNYLIVFLIHPFLRLWFNLIGEGVRVLQSPTDVYITIHLVCISQQHVQFISTH
jgi:hypothetical protein